MPRLVELRWGLSQGDKARLERLAESYARQKGLVNPIATGDVVLVQPQPLLRRAALGSLANGSAIARNKGRNKGGPWLRKERA